MKIKLLSISLLFLYTYAFSKECEFVPRTSFCGVDLQASQVEFIKILGQPSAIINLDGGAVSLIFSNSKESRVTSLIFERNKLNELSSWETNPNIDFWNRFVDREVIKVKIGNTDFIGRPRGGPEDLPPSFVVEDADGNGQNLRYLEVQFDVIYLPFYGPSTYSLSEFNNYTEYRGHSIVLRHINFENSSHGQE